MTAIPAPGNSQWIPLRIRRGRAVTLLDLDEPSTREHVTRCAACKHTLKTPESRALGVGPDCAEKLGVAPRKPLRITGIQVWRDCEGQTSLEWAPEGTTP